ncbi:MAG: hypothetical protein EOP11_14315, partial [Proteobacteria bacterium]
MEKKPVCTLLEPKDFRAMPWKNGRGTTQEIAVEPSAASLDDGSMLWRLSTAPVVEDGPFSQFPGFSRFLALTEGTELGLGFPNRNVTLRAGDVYHFGGEEKVEARLLFMSCDNGIVPLRDFMAKAAGSSKKSLELQSIITFAPKIGLGYGEFVELLCLLGVFLALGGLVIRKLSNALTFGLLWYMYYSISLVGQGFMSFHSDLLLLEVGFIT